MPIHFKNLVKKMFNFKSVARILRSVVTKTNCLLYSFDCLTIGINSLRQISSKYNMVFLLHKIKKLQHISERYSLQNSSHQILFRSTRIRPQCCY